MRITSLGITNFRLFGETQTISVQSDKNVLIFLGDNGAGKTSALDAIAIGLAPYVETFPNESKKTRTRAFSLADVHCKGKDSRAVFAQISMDVTANSESFQIKRIKKGYGLDTPESDLRGIKKYAQDIIEQIQKSSSVEIPIVVYYGTGRGQITVPERKRGFQKVFNRWDCYQGALVAATDFKRFFAWFDLMEDEERRIHEKQHNFDYKNRSLLAVKEAINRFVGEKFINPRTETHPLRFVVSAQDGSELRIEQLSDGYKIVIAMVADIASKMAEANPDMEIPLNASGIVLVDEIDLHLHPLWQRTILKQLHETFPNVQFIVTTHSPSVVLGAAEISQVVKLDGGNINENQIDYSYFDVSQLLLSHLFNEVDTRTPECEKILKRRDELLAKDKLNEEERTELNQLDEDVSRFAFGESKKVMDINKKMVELLQRLSGNA